MKHYGRLVWFWCYCKTYGDDFVARDMAQDAWLLVWDHLDRLRPDASPHEVRAWLKALTRTASSRRFRHEHHPVVPLTRDIEVAEDTRIAEMRETLETLIAYLPDDDRRLMNYLLDGFRLDEIALELDISLDAVHRRYHRAIHRMKKISNQQNL